VLATSDGIPHGLVHERMQLRLWEIASLHAALRDQRKELLALKSKLEREWAQGKCLALDPELAPINAESGNREARAKPRVARKVATRQ
jgi:hypothetical protein